MWCFDSEWDQFPPVDTPADSAPQPVREASVVFDVEVVGGLSHCMQLEHFGSTNVIQI